MEKKDNIITQDDFLKLGKKLKETEQDDTPFQMVKNGELAVIGDANKTEVKKNNYVINFRFPCSYFDEPPKEARKIDNFYIVSVEYENITVTPRSNLKIVDSILQLQQFFKKISEENNAEIQDMDQMELLHAFASAGDEIHLAMYNFVAVFLGISDEMGEYMQAGSVVKTIAKIMETHPEVFNEADVFFE